MKPLRLLALLLSLLLLPALHAEPTVVTVDPRQTRQEFQGMGCGAIFYEAHITSLGGGGKKAEQEQLYDDLFAKVRTGFLQLMIRHDAEPQNDNADPYTQAFAPGAFDWCSHSLEISAAAKKRNPSTRLYAVFYTPPAWMKTNNNPSGGGKTRGTLKEGLELEMAEYLWAYLTHMHRHGQSIDFLSICNEPDWPHDQPGYFLTPERHASLFAKVAAYLETMARRHPDVPMPKLVAPNMLSAVDAADRVLPALLKSAGRHVAVVGCHDYDRRGERWTKLRKAAGARPLWMTECSFNGEDKSPGLIRSAGEYWLYMTEAFNQGVNVWMAYDWVYPPRQGGEALVHVEWGRSYQLTKIYHGFRQWCAPLSPGMKIADTRVAGPFASGISKPGIKAASFVSPDGRTLVVHLAAVQDADAEVEIRLGSPFERARHQSWRTSGTEDIAKLPDGSLDHGRLTTKLPARAMLTLRFSASEHPAQNAWSISPANPSAGGPTYLAEKSPVLRF